MAFDVNNPYFRTRVLTASPEQLRLLLIEGCIRFLRDGREAMGAKDYLKTHESFTGARNIIMELINTLRHEIAPELCGKMEALYLYMFNLVVEGSFDKNPAKIDEAIELMEYERETWLLLMQKLAEERGEGAQPVSSADSLSLGTGQAAPAYTAPATGATGGQRVAFSAQG